MNVSKLLLLLQIGPFFQCFILLKLKNDTLVGPSIQLVYFLIFSVGYTANLMLV